MNNMKKRILAMISAAVLSTTLLASAALVSAEETETIDGSGLKIGMVVNNSGQDPYQSAYYETMVSAAKEYGCDLQILDPKGDATKQAEQIQDLINMNCDSIIVWPINGEQAVASVRAIDKAGIPCLTANTNVSEAGEAFIKCYVGPSNVEEGKASAQEMVNQLGPDAKIVEISGPAGYTTSLERTEGMHQGIEGTNVEILDSQTGEGNREKCQQVMENYLQKYAAGEIDAVFTFDDNGAYGAWNAIEAAGRQDDVKIFAAAAGSYETLDYIRDGKIAATAMQSPRFDAGETLVMAIKLAKGEEPEEFYNYITTPVATAENVDDLGLEAW